MIFQSSLDETATSSRNRSPVLSVQGDSEHHKIHDDANFGKITLSEILEKSSNVGVSKVASTLNKKQVYHFLMALGFGEPRSLLRLSNVAHLFSKSTQKCRLAA